MNAENNDKAVWRIIDVDEKTDLLSALRSNDLYVKSSCGGHASCTDCVIKILNGADEVTTPTFEETQLLGNVFHLTKERLACQTFCHGDIEIDISKHDKVSDQVKLKNKTQSQFRLKNNSNIKRRKQEEVQEIMSEREKDYQEKKR